MQNRALMKVQRALSGRHSNASTCQACAPKHGRAASKKPLAALARAVRPASLAASARPERLEAGAHLTNRTALEAEQRQVQPFQGRSASWPSVALRSNARPNTKRRGGSGFGLLASVTAQRTMHAGCVPQNALPNPSIERTFSGKPENASHLKR
jgi:hypothetical protein